MVEGGECVECVRGGWWETRRETFALAPRRCLEFLLAFLLGPLETRGSAGTHRTTPGRTVRRAAPHSPPSMEELG